MLGVDVLAPTRAVANENVELDCCALGGSDDSVAVIGGAEELS